MTVGRLACRWLLLIARPYSCNEVIPADLHCFHSSASADRSGGNRGRDRDVQLACLGSDSQFWR
jgi:hypothetical protein